MLTYSQPHSQAEHSVQPLKHNQTLNNTINYCLLLFTGYTDDSYIPFKASGETYFLTTKNSNTDLVKYIAFWEVC